MYNSNEQSALISTSGLQSVRTLKKLGKVVVVGGAVEGEMGLGGSSPGVRRLCKEAL